MRQPDPPEGTRFFARPHALTMECPKCGVLLYLSDHARRGKPTPGWDPRTSRLRCTGCAKVYVIGILAWPVQKGTGRIQLTIPRDQVPDERQLAELRAMGGGIWAPQDQAKPRKRADDTNVTQIRCRCGEEPKVHCRLHGSVEYRSQAREEPEVRAWGKTPK